MGLSSRHSRIPLLAVWLAFVLMAPCSFCQTPDIPKESPPEKENKRIFWIIPNNRTAPSLKDYHPLTAKQKFHLATLDAFDPGTVLLAAAVAGESQLTNSNPSFGQGGQGYGHYLATSYADLFLGKYMTEAIYPALLHQDPRYFRSGTGRGWSRVGYAVRQLFWTHTDSGGRQFNFSELAGNSTAVAISTAYYPENRNATDSLTKLGTLIGFDLAGNLLKEFWPDLNRKFSRKHHSHQP